MSFVSSFRKVAEESSPEEKESVRKVKELHISVRPTLLALENRGEPAKVGARVYYSGETGWKTGDDAAHTKGGCSVDDEQEPARKAYEEQVRKEVTKTHADKSMHWRVINDRVEHKFPKHHDGDWRDEAVRNPDMGTIEKIDAPKSGYRNARYDIRWDRHPNCVWGNYSGSELRHAELPFEISTKYLVRSAHELPKYIEHIKAKAAELGSKIEIVPMPGYPNGWRGIRKELIIKSSKPEIIEYIKNTRYDDAYRNLF